MRRMRGWAPIRACSRRVCSCAAPDQIDDREDADPDDVQRVPEEIEADQPVNDLAAETFDLHLRHHGGEPHPADRHVQAVQTYQAEKRREHSAPLWREAAL